MRHCPSSVVRDQLNAAVKGHGLHLHLTLQTTSRATIGGMIANNSSGTKSIKYGKTIDHVLGLKVLLMDGTLLQLGELTAEAYEAKCQQTDREGEIYRSFRKIIFEHAATSKRHIPGDAPRQRISTRRIYSHRSLESG
ncbi:MAG: FAD-binding oxidoreductase [Saprospiraceae bacterium]|nr:FAD-binding oxidoreductase [Saprospiraceae bacterium]